MKYLEPMNDWCLSKDFNGAERFADGSRPLMAEIGDCVVIVSGYDPSRKDVRAWVTVHSECGGFVAGLAENKEKGAEKGELIAECISEGKTKNEIEKFFKSQDFAEIDGTLFLA